MISPTPRHRLYNTAAGARRRGNPYFAGGKSDNFGASIIKNILARVSPSAWLWFLLSLLIIAFLAWLLLFSNLLVIKTIKIKGNNLIPANDLEAIVNDRLARNRFLFLSESRLAVFNSKALKQTILDHYALDRVKINKQLPFSLVVTISEKTPVAIWFEADTYQEVDMAGWILASVGGQVEGLPTIYNNGAPRINNKKVSEAEKIIPFVKNLNLEFSNHFSNIKIKQLTIDNDQNTVKLVPERGALIYFSTLDDLLMQLDRLDVLLLSELKDRFEKINYVDLRFGDKVYYK